MDLSEHNTEHLLDFFDEETVNKQKGTIGRSTGQILMKNPILRGLKKFLMKDQQIKNVLSEKERLLEIIQDIKPLQTLCLPTQLRFRSRM